MWFCRVSRYVSKDILTIREAVWLTDNTYKYEDLVRMMGEVVSVLEGKIRVSGRRARTCFAINPKRPFVHDGHCAPNACRRACLN